MTIRSFRGNVEFTPWRIVQCSAAALAISAGNVTGLEAWAQTAPVNSSADTRPNAGRNQGAPEEVVVTARRRAEKLSKVPVSVTALSSKALTEKHITTEQDLQSSVPGLTVYGVNSSNSLNFSLRGQSVDAFSFAAPAVLTYVNEFSVLSDSASTLYDLASVQVLKGPQGTLFGRNATGGAILYQTMKPQPDFGGYITGGYGNYDDHTLEGALNIPLTQQLGELRVSWDYEKRNGFQDNLLLRMHDGSLDNAGFRASWLLHPIDGLDSLTVVSLQHSGGNSIGLKATDVYLPGETNNGVPINPALPAGAIYVPGVIVQNPSVQELGFNGIVDFLAKQRNYGFYDIFDAQTDHHNGLDVLYSNNTSYQVEDWLTLKNVIGYHRSSSLDNTDIDGEPYQPLTIGIQDGAAANGYRFHDDQASEEFQGSGKVLDDKLSYITGVYFFYGYSQSLEQLNIFGDLVNPVTGQPIPPAADFLRSFIYFDHSLGTYAQGTYSITENLHITTGIRYTTETIHYTQGGGDEEALIGVKPASLTNAKPSWTGSLDYRVSPDLLVYATTRGSWRAGGFNGTSQNFLPDGQPVAQSFKPETTVDVELGAKYYGQIFSKPVNFDIALYDQHIWNVIRAIYFNDSANSGNVARAEVKGIEIDGSVYPVRWLQIGFSGAYTDAQYTNPIASIDNLKFIFGPYGDTPRLSGSLYARATQDLSDGSQLVGRVDYYGQTSFFYSNLYDTILPDTRIPAYSLVNLRAEWNNIRQTRLSLAAFVNNVADEHYFTGGFPLGAVTGINSVLEGLPRMYGFQLNYKF